MRQSHRHAPTVAPDATVAAPPAMAAAAAWWQAARLALGTASALGLARFAYGLLVPAMRAQLGWSLAQAGALNTANGLGYLLGALAVAPVAHRLGGTVTFRCGMAVTAAALGVPALSAGYPVLLFARALAGASGALVYVVGGVMASRLATRAGSVAPMVVFFAGSGLGIAVSGALIPALLGPSPGRWPLVWAGMAVAAVLATAVSWGAAAGAPAGHRPAGTPAGRPAAGRTTGRDLTWLVRLWPVTTAYVLFAAGYIAYTTFLSADLVARHAGVARITLTWTLLGLAAAAGPLVWSRPIAWDSARALALALALLGGAAGLALVSSSTLVLTGSAVICGGSFLGVPSAVTGLIRTAVPAAAWTGVLAAFTVVFAAGLTAGPYLAGALADRYGAGATLAWTAALCLSGATLAALPRRPGRRNVSPVTGTRMDSRDPGI